MNKTLLNLLKMHTVRGFTILELIFVILIVGILAAMSLPQFTGVIQDTYSVKIEGVRSNIIKNRTLLKSIQEESPALVCLNNTDDSINYWLLVDGNRIAGVQAVLIDKSSSDHALGNHGPCEEQKIKGKSYHIDFQPLTDLSCAYILAALGGLSIDVINNGGIHQWVARYEKLSSTCQFTLVSSHKLFFMDVSNGSVSKIQKIN